MQSAAVLLCVGILAATVRYADAVLEARSPAADAGQFVYVPDPRFLRIASLGYTSAVADILWFRTISYFGAHYRSDRLYPWLAKMCDVVTDLDPRAEYVYRFAGVILPWEAKRPDDGIALLDKGIKHFPNSWLFYYLQGTNLYFFKNDVKRAARYLGRAAELPGADPYAVRLAAAMYQHGFNPAAAESFLRELANSAQDATMRRVVEVRLKELKIARDFDALEAVVRRYRRQTGQSPASLQALVEAGMLNQIPPEPFGGSYTIDATTGAISTTSGHLPLRLRESRAHKEYQKGNTVYW
jgi:tetratricopeptide (TPR) repeat protein